MIELCEKTCGPTEGKWFYVNPKGINQNLFLRTRHDEAEERVRKLIRGAFYEVKMNHELVKPFMTLMPEKTWQRKTGQELEELAHQLGGHIGNWVEQAIEWAQRISNGETWKELCHEPDTASWYRLVAWEKGIYQLVGGAKENEIDYAPTHVSLFCYRAEETFRAAVPLVVST